jgi:hypothetical protein
VKTKQQSNLMELRLSVQELCRFPLEVYMKQHISIYSVNPIEFNAFQERLDSPDFFKAELNYLTIELSKYNFTYHQEYLNDLTNHHMKVEQIYLEEKLSGLLEFPNLDYTNLLFPLNN